MFIDAYTHFIPKRFFETVLVAGDHKDIGKRVRNIPCIVDLDERRKVVGHFKDYAQILSYSQPPIEEMVGPDRSEDLTRMINDGFAEIIAKYPSEFPGFVAQVSLGNSSASESA
ncbi:MAG: hypothetical protein R3D52_10175 [Xanthobacteraceae bacterium]